MSGIRNILFKGLVAILPLGVTIYIVYWLGSGAESLLSGVIKLVIPDQYYRPGMGLVTGLLIVFSAGLAVNAWTVRHFLNLSERLMARIPLVKTIHGMIRDFTDFLSMTSGKSELKQVVSVSMGAGRVIGFVTRERVDDLPLPGVSDDTVAVYFPMSYQIGGYMVFLPRSQVTPLDIPVEKALRLILTAGLGAPTATVLSNGQVPGEQAAAMSGR